MVQHTGMRAGPRNNGAGDCGRDRTAPDAHHLHVAQHHANKIRAFVAEKHYGIYGPALTKAVGR
jgi:hypothetical protein